MFKDNKPKSRPLHHPTRSYATYVAPRPTVVTTLGSEAHTATLGRQAAAPAAFIHLSLGSALRTLGFLVLVGVVVLTNLERLKGVWSQYVPRTDDVTLEGPTPQMLFIRSNPPGARVFLNDRDVGRTPYAQGYSDAGARMQVRIEAPGYHPWRATVDLTDEGSQLDVNLKRRLRRDLPALVLAQR